MAWAVIAHDRADTDTRARRLALRERHLALITPMAEDGRLLLGVPLFGADGRVVGSLMMLAGGHDFPVRSYLEAEPFNDGTVWQRIDRYPFRVAPLPYRRLVDPSAPAPVGRTHTVIVAMDGTEAGALDRRQAVRAGHFERARPMAEDGTLAFGGAILDRPNGRMIGTIAVVRRDTDEAARAWMEETPTVIGDAWRSITLYGTRFAPLPHRPLPGSAA